MPFLRLSPLVSTRRALRPPSEASGLLARWEPCLKTLAKLPWSLSEALEMLSTLLRDFWRELGRSEPIAPQLPLADVRELARLGSASPERLPEPLRPESDSLSVSGVAASAVSETGLMLPLLLVLQLLQLLLLMLSPAAGPEPDP